MVEQRIRNAWVVGSTPSPGSKEKAMKIITVKVGSLQTNCYIVIDEKTKEALVIDPGDEPEKIISQLAGLKVRYIVLTHGHPDHFGALDAVKEKTKALLLMSAEDDWFFRPDKKLNDGDKIKIGALSFEVLHTPGHSPGSICLYSRGHLFSGDTLFSTTHGRTDLPGGSREAMQKSLQRLVALPDDTLVYPGHDESTSIGQEKERGTLE